MWASAGGQVNCVRLLLDRGAQTDLQTKASANWRYVPIYSCYCIPFVKWVGSIRELWDRHILGLGCIENGFQVS